jgi:hypothetical protein
VRVYEAILKRRTKLNKKCPEISGHFLCFKLEPLLWYIFVTFKTTIYYTIYEKFVYHTLLFKNKPALTFCIISLFFLSACKKELLTTQSPLDNAKIWYAQQKSRSFLKSSRGDSIEIKQEPQWEIAQTVNLPDGETAVVVPIFTN